MKTRSEGLRLRVFVHETLRHDHKPLYCAIVEQARQAHLAGATVFRGIEGYGLHRHLHTTRLVDVSDDLPIVVEIVDTPEAIRRFLPTLDGLIPPRRRHALACLDHHVQHRKTIMTYSAGKPS